jgi:hypothetical protein
MVETNTQKLTFKDYYKQLGKRDPQIELRNRIISECGISTATFYKWLNRKTDTIPKLARQKISEITGIPVEDLFPD